jgi:hypothetical protein
MKGMFILLAAIVVAGAAGYLYVRQADARKTPAADRPAVAPTPQAEQPQEQPAPEVQTAPQPQAPSPAVNAPSPAESAAEPVAAAPPAAPAPPVASAPQAPQPAQPPALDVAAQQQPYQPITPPPLLAPVRFGMARAQVVGLYNIAWTRQEAGEAMLVHYPTADKHQMVRFYFSPADSLYRIEMRFEPAEGQTVKGLYDLFRSQLAQQYANVLEKSEAHWSDGTVVVRIGVVMGSVEVSFTCPSAKP